MPALSPIEFPEQLTCDMATDVLSPSAVSVMSDSDPMQCGRVSENRMSESSGSCVDIDPISVMNCGRIANCPTRISKLVYSTVDLADASEPTEVLSNAWMNGCNAFVCSGEYGNGKAETILGNWLQTVKREDVCILVQGDSASCVDDSLRRLQTHYADVFVLSGSEEDEDSAVRAVDTMSELCERGLCLTWGVEEWSAAQILSATNYARASGKHGPACDFVRTTPQTLLSPKMTDANQPLYVKENMAMFAIDCEGSFGASEDVMMENATGSDLPGSNRVSVERTSIVAESKDVSPGQLSIACVLNQSYTSFVVVKTTDLAYFRDNARATAVELSPEELSFVVCGADSSVVHTDVVTPGEMIDELPLSAKAAYTVLKARGEIGQILDGRDDRVIAITGPCSIHDPVAAYEYAVQLKKFADAHKDTLVVVMRTYFEKPRTTVGWKGLLTDPDLNDTCNINKGLRLCRNLLLRINELGIPCAVELLSNVSPAYFSDLVSWAAIGARTTESQVHREMVSGMSQIPIGFKNGTQGNVDIALDAAKCASAPHSFLTVGPNGRVGVGSSGGNKHCHVILRGGKQGPNFSAKHVAECDDAMRSNNLRKRLIVDCSHGNSNKNHANQPKVVGDISQQIIDGSQVIGGVMIESNLVEGAQKLDPGKTDVSTLKYGQSVTDACVNMETTERMFSELAHSVKRRRLRL